MSRLIFTNIRSARKKSLETRRARQIQSIDKSKAQDDYVVDSVRQLSVTSWAILIEKSHRSGNEARREMRREERSINLLDYPDRVRRTRTQGARRGEGGGGRRGGMDGGPGRSVPKARDRKPTIDYQACYYDGERRFFRG